MRQLMLLAAGMGVQVHGTYLDDEVFGYYSPDRIAASWTCWLVLFGGRAVNLWAGGVRL